MSKISDKTDKSLSNYSYLFWGPLFIGTQCSVEILWLYFVSATFSIFKIGVQKNPFFKKSPTYWVFLGFTGFWALLGFLDFLSEPAANLLLKFASSLDYLNIRKFITWQTKIEINLLQVFFSGCFIRFYPKNPALILNTVFYIILQAVVAFGCHSLLTITSWRCAPLSGSRAFGGQRKPAGARCCSLYISTAAKCKCTQRSVLKF